MIDVAPAKEGELIPPWPTRFAMGDCNCSPTLEIDVPDDFKLTWYTNGELIEN